MVRNDTLPDIVLQEFCAQLKLEPSMLTPLRAFENFVYSLGPSAGQKILRISHRSHRQREDIAAELDWVRFLDRSGVAISCPVMNEIIEAGSGEYCAIVISRVPGETVQYPGSLDCWGPALYREWGRTLGQLHRVTQDYQPPEGSAERWSWSEDRYATNWKNYVDSNSAMNRLWEETQESLRALPRSRKNFGLIHADLHSKNFYLHEGRLQVFDTDDCLYHWFVADFSSVFASLLLGPAKDKPKEFMAEFLAPFWRGYFSESDLSREEVSRLPLFLTYRFLLLYGAIHHKWNFNKLSPRELEFVDGVRSYLELGSDDFIGSPEYWTDSLPAETRA